MVKVSIIIDRQIDKIFTVYLIGQVTISNDGATIMKLLEVVQPAAKTLVDIARSQDAEVSVVTIITIKYTSNDL
jgi:hypothetical protein